MLLALFDQPWIALDQNINISLNNNTNNTHQSWYKYP